MNAQRTADIETIHRFVAAVEASQRNRSPDDFIALFSPDAVWVTGGGVRLTGRDEIDAFTRRVLTPALGDVHATYKVEHVLFVDDDVAAVNVRATPVHAEAGSSPRAITASSSRNSGRTTALHHAGYGRLLAMRGGPKVSVRTARRPSHRDGSRRPSGPWGRCRSERGRAGQGAVR